jgi:hypothetical protein
MVCRKTLGGAPYTQAARNLEKERINMATPAQTTANQTNAQFSTGPKTEEGKAASSKNNFRHGLAGRFMLHSADDREEFRQLAAALREEHQPETATEVILVERMAESFWLSRRAMKFQTAALEDGDDQGLALYLRYQTTHDRSFHKCLADLLKLKAEKRKAEIGFESQKQKEAEEQRREELHKAKVRAINAKATDQEIDADIRKTVEAPLPGHVRMPFDEVKAIFRQAVYQVNEEMKAQQAA